MPFENWFYKGRELPCITNPGPAGVEIGVSTQTLRQAKAPVEFRVDAKKKKTASYPPNRQDIAYR